MRGKVFGLISVLAIIIILFSFETETQTSLGEELSKIADAPDISKVEKFDKNHPYRKYANNPSVIESARQMEQRFGIPMEFHIMQGALESYGGRSRIAQLTGNHFGIKCTKKHDHEANGCVWSKSDKDWFEYHGKGVWVTYKKHSDFLRKHKRYKKAFKCNDKYTDIRKLNECWCNEVARAGYAYGPKAHEMYRDQYAEQLKAYIIKADMYDNPKLIASRMGPHQPSASKKTTEKKQSKTTPKPPVKKEPSEQEKILWYLQGQMFVTKYGGKEYGIIKE